MASKNTFETIELADLLNVTRAKHDAGYRFVQMLCTMTDDGVDLVYSFMGRPDGEQWCLENYKICGFDRETQTVPSVTGYYLSAFPFENEAHDLFGVKVEGNAIDFAGRFYQVSMDEPMTVISPEQKAAKEKAARAAAAKAAKADKAAKAAKAAQEAQPNPVNNAAKPADATKSADVAAEPAGDVRKSADDAAQKGGE